MDLNDDYSPNLAGTIFFDGRTTSASFENYSAATEKYKNLRRHFSTLVNIPNPESRFDMKIRLAIMALVYGAMGDTIEKVPSQHLLSKTYAKHFGMQVGQNVIYMDAMNPLTFEKVFIEHAPLVVAQRGKQFYTDFSEHLMGKIETNYNSSLNKILTKQDLNILDIFDIALFISMLAAKWPLQNGLPIDLKDKERLSDRITNRLMAETIILMLDYDWNVVVLPENNPNLSFSTSFTPSVEAVVEIDKEILYVTNPFNGKRMPAIRWFPLSAKLGIYFVSKEWKAKLAYYNDPALKTELLLKGNYIKTIDFRSAFVKYNSYDVYKLVNTANLSILKDVLNIADSNKQSAVLFRPCDAPYANTLSFYEEAYEAQFGITIEKAAGLRNPTLTSLELQQKLSLLKTPKPTSIKPSVNNVSIDAPFQDWWDEVLKSSIKISNHLGISSHNSFNKEEDK